MLVKISGESHRSNPPVVNWKQRTPSAVYLTQTNRFKQGTRRAGRSGFGLGVPHFDSESTLLGIAGYLVLWTRNLECLHHSYAGEALLNELRNLRLAREEKLWL